MKVLGTGAPSFTKLFFSDYTNTQRILPNAYYNEKVLIINLDSGMINHISKSYNNLYTFNLPSFITTFGRQFGFYNSESKLYYLLVNVTTEHPSNTTGLNECWLSTINMTDWNFSLVKKLNRESFSFNFNSEFYIRNVTDSSIFTSFKLTTSPFTTGFAKISLVSGNETGFYNNLQIGLPISNEGNTHTYQVFPNNTDYELRDVDISTGVVSNIRTVNFRSYCNPNWQQASIYRSGGVLRDGVLYVSVNQRLVSNTQQPYNFDVLTFDFNNLMFLKRITGGGRLLYIDYAQSVILPNLTVFSQWLNNSRMEVFDLEIQPNRPIRDSNKKVITS